MPLPALTSTVCSICGEPLQGNQNCLACLLRGGLAECDGTASSPDSLGFGDFEIKRHADGSAWELGRGAMGVTYRARDKVLHRDVALKVIEGPVEKEGAQTARERFLREARAAAALRHPNVAGVFQFAAADRCYYAMELVEGETLEEFVRREGPLSAGAALAMAIQVARALVAAAEHQLVHRDLKPANIMIVPNEHRTEMEVKVIDFGLAKVTAGATNEMDLTHGGFVGTPTFASPEQFAGEAADARSDIYSLGVTLWYALTGEVPYRGKTIEEIRHSRKQFALPVEQLLARKLPASVVSLLRRSLATDPAERPQCARALLGELESCRATLSGRRWRRPAVIAFGILTLSALCLTSYWLWHKPVETSLPPAKSIAILPFENLSKDEANAYFAAGIQDDLLTSLAQIHELKVISRTSVMAYKKPSARNMRQIGRELGVATVIEGSVRRVGDRVVLNVQLVDTRTDHELWANHYDNVLADSLGLRGQLAHEIATALKANLAPEEEARLETRPTDNPQAYALYLKALGREGVVNQSVEDVTVAATLYEKAIALDPKFALARARLSLMTSFLAKQPSSDPVLKVKARAEAEEALRLSPSLGAAHLALGLCLYWGDRDYSRALGEFLLAAETLPNEPYLYYFISGIYRAQGRWSEALATMQRAQERDPRNHEVFLRAGDNHLFVRDWAGATECFQRGLKLAPDSADATISLAYIAVFRDGNPAAGEKLLHTLPAGIDPDGIVTEARWDMAMLERDWAGAEKILADSPATGFPRSGKGAKEFLAGRTALARGDSGSARRFFALAAPGFEEWLKQDPTDASRHARLGLLYAYMQRNEDSLRESLRAVELEPAARDALRAAQAQANLALVYALLKERDQALNLVESLLSTPGPLDWPDFPPSITLFDLRLRWEWDTLRHDSRFHKIIGSAEPKTILTNGAPPAPLASEKSIAVLPFENLSNKQQNAYFAAGIQDDILTSLAKIHELRVVSRTSVMNYKKPGSRNMREIGRALGVQNVLEGSVRREGNRVLLNVQLIDARNDRHLWAERYDRTGADAIGLQGELASEIAAALQAKLAPEEAERLAKKPTVNPEAYTLYLRGLGWERVVNPSDESRTTAEQLYAQAVALDPKFALARARLSIVETDLAGGVDGRIPGAKARPAAEEALRLSPFLGEAHLALGLCYYSLDKNYPAALREFSIAAATLPNEPNIQIYIAYVYRRQGRWHDSIAAFRRARQLDPRNVHVLSRAAANYLLVRDWAAATECYNRAQEIAPDSAYARIGLAYLQVFRDNNPTAAGNIMQSDPTGIDPDGVAIRARWDFAMLARDYQTAEKILANSPSATLPGAEDTSKSFCQGLIARARGDTASALRHFAAATPAFEASVRARPDLAWPHDDLGMLYAYQGRKEDALRECLRAVEIEPENRDAFHGAVVAGNLAVTYALIGDTDRAIPLIERLLATPGPVETSDSPNIITLADLRLRPEWDALRKDPRFQQILSSPEPKTILPK